MQIYIKLLFIFAKILIRIFFYKKKTIFTLNSISINNQVITGIIKMLLDIIFLITIFYNKLLKTLKLF